MRKLLKLKTAYSYNDRESYEYFGMKSILRTAFALNAALSRTTLKRFVKKIP